MLIIHVVVVICFIVNIFVIVILISVYDENKNVIIYGLISFLCPRDDSQGALRFAPVCPSVCPSVSSSRFRV